METMDLSEALASFTTKDNVANYIGSDGKQTPKQAASVLGGLLGINDVIRDTNQIISSKEVLDATLSSGVYRVDSIVGLSGINYTLLLVLKTREYVSQIFFSPTSGGALFRGYHNASKVWSKLYKFSTNAVE